MGIRVFISGPLSKGDLVHNLDQATEVFVKLAKAGLAPFCPQWSVYAKPALRLEIESANGRDKRTAVVCEATTTGNDAMTHAEWLAVDLAWVAVSDALLRLPGESVGADREVRHARECNVPVFTNLEALIAWAANAPRAA